MYRIKTIHIQQTLALLSFVSVLSHYGTAIAFAPQTNSEGRIEQGHDPAFQNLRSRFILTQGRVDLEKAEKILKPFLSQQIELLKGSAYLGKKVNLLETHNLSLKEAQKKAEKVTTFEKADLLAPFLFAQAELDKVLKQKGIISATKAEKALDNIMLFVAAGYTIYPEGITTSLVERSKNLAENFYDFKIDDSGAVQASNILKSAHKDSFEFYSQNELKNMRARGIDISTLNPPQSAVWENNNIEAFDPKSEIMMGKRLFPDPSIEVPEVFFERMGNGQVKFKGDFYDTFDLDKKGKPKKKSVTLRTGWETYTATVTHQLARAVGYHAIPSVFRKKIKLILGDMTKEAFLTAYKRVHGNEQGSAANVIEFIPNENAVYIKNSTLEAYPDDDDYRKMGPFRMGDNGLRNRREYRAMVMFNTLISLQDHFEYQTRVDAYHDPKTDTWHPLYFIADTSSALGLPAELGNRGTVNEYTWEMTKKTDEKIYLFWFSFFNSRAWQDTTYSDIKWMARRILRLSSQQIDGIFQASGFPDPVKLLYAEKMKNRINKMALDLGLAQKENLPHKVKSKEEIAKIFPGWIDEKGYLKGNGQEYPGTTYPVLGDRFTIPQAIYAKGLQAIQNALLKAVNPAELLKITNRRFDLGSVSLQGGVMFNASRSVSVNSDVSPDQKRYVLTDRMTISLPLGQISEDVKQPLSVYHLFSFELKHSVSTINDIQKENFFYLLNPFSIKDIRENLKIGQQLRISHGFGGSVGHLGIKQGDDLAVEATLFGVEKQKIKTLYFSKATDQLLEVYSNVFNATKFGSNIEVKTIARLGLGWASSKTKEQEKIYRIYALTDEEKALAEPAFEKALVQNDFSDLNAVLTPVEVSKSTKQSSFQLHLGLWGFQKSDSVSVVNLPGKKVILATDFESSDRAFDRLWTEKLNPGPVAKAPLNYFGGFWKKGEYLDFGLESTLRPDSSGVESMQLMITATLMDNILERKEFDRKVKPFFAQRAGQENYINWTMPEGLKQFIEFQGVMKYQISTKGLVNILNAAIDWKNTEYLAANQPHPSDDMSPSYVNPQERAAYLAGKILKLINSSTETKKEKAFKEMSREMIELIKLLIGHKGEHLARLRAWAQDENLWLTTGLINILDNSHPSFREGSSSTFWANEIGQFQGHSDLKKFYLENTMTPTRD